MDAPVAYHIIVSRYNPRAIIFHFLTATRQSLIDARLEKFRSQSSVFIDHRALRMLVSSFPATRCLRRKIRWIFHRGSKTYWTPRRKFSSPSPPVSYFADLGLLLTVAAEMHQHRQIHNYKRPAALWSIIITLLHGVTRDVMDEPSIREEAKLRLQTEGGRYRRESKTGSKSQNAETLSGRSFPYRVRPGY